MGLTSKDCPRGVLVGLGWRAAVARCSLVVFKAEVGGVRAKLCAKGTSHMVLGFLGYICSFSSVKKAPTSSQMVTTFD